MAGTADAKELEKYLDPKVLSQVMGLDLRTRMVVEGFMSGLHRSPYHGQSIEFAQHREYVSGDDIRHIDWKVFSRTDRFYIKLYEEETNLRCTFLVDVSESMRYAGASRSGQGLSKFHYAACLASAMSLLLIRQQDAAGLITFAEDVVQVIPPSANPNHIKPIVHALDQAGQHLSAKTSIANTCRKVVEKLGSRGMVVVLSDLLVDNDDELMKSLIRLAHRGHDVLVMHVMDEEELKFPFDGNTRFVGLEDMGDLIGEPRSLREGYLASLRDYLAKIERGCRSNRIGYQLISTGDHLGAVLANFLAARSASGRSAASKHR